MSDSSGKYKKPLAIIGSLLIIALIVVAALMSNKDKNEKVVVEYNDADVPLDALPYSSTVVPGEEGELIIPEVLQTAVVTVPGANPIIPDGTVMTVSGSPVQNDAAPLSADAPQQTPPIAPEQLSASAINLTVSGGIWTPAEFTVKAGAPITLALTVDDDNHHFFLFNDPSLQAVVVGLSPHETRALTFNAPEQVGEYSFSCNVPGHADRGEKGKMLVR